MIPLGMVMRNIFAQGPPQGALTNENDLRQTLLLDRSHPALSVVHMIARILARLRWRPPWPRGKGVGVRVSPVSFPICLHFRRLVIGLTVPVSAEYEPDKSNRQKDGAGYDQPMWIFHLSIPSSRSFSPRLQHEAPRL
jgi:hypothetical protein